MPIWLEGQGSPSGAMRGRPTATTSAALVCVFSIITKAMPPAPFFPARLRSGDSHPGRRRRMEHHHPRRRVRQSNPADSIGIAISSFAWVCCIRPSPIIADSRSTAANTNSWAWLLTARPIYGDAILRHLVDLKPDGSFRLNMSYFHYSQGLRMTSSEVSRPLRRSTALARVGPRAARTWTSPRAFSTSPKKSCLRIGRDLHRQTGSNNLVLAGGVALNCVANGRLLREGPFEDLWIQPAAGDAGGAWARPLFVWHQLLERPRQGSPATPRKGSLLGPRFRTRSDREGRTQNRPTVYERGRTAGPSRRLAGRRKGGRLVSRAGWNSGPRALGARSISAIPASPKMQATMNLKIKYRESFRPFAPIVLADHAHEWFDLKPGQESPYMLLVAPCVRTAGCRLSRATPCDER